MPYISKARRDALFSDSLTDFNNTPSTKGELNYLITEIMIDYLNHHGLSYTNISNASDAARDAANEMDRRILSLYEDKMAKKNGDVYKSLIKQVKGL